MINFFKNKQFRLGLLFIILLELISLAGYLVPTINLLAFVVICLAFLIIAFKDLHLALWLVLLELIIGSKGYLFSGDILGTQLAIRIALWIILMSVWFLREIQHYWQDRKLSWPFSYYRYFWLALAVFLTYGLAWGILKHNDPSNIFLDFNNWLYLLIVLPAYRLLNQENYKQYWPLLMAGLSWLVLKTLLLLFAFSHNLFLANTEIYRWVRDTGIAEVTEMQSGFYRIFMQSHIYVILAWLGIILLVSWLIKKKQTSRYWLLALVALGAVVVISLSRSFWAGLVVGLLVYWPLSLFYFKLNWQQIIKTNISWFVALLVGFVLIFGIVVFPYPKPWLDVSMLGLLSDRTDIMNEAGAASRWSLLPELWGGITINPLSGQGFGATLTYQTDDPRIRQSSVDGSYTTYAFEWGWLDIWFKLGVLGWLAYLVFLGKLIWDGFKTKQLLGVYLSSSLIVLTAIHFFTPYLNHPLGLGYLAIAVVYLDLLRQQSQGNSSLAKK